MLRRNFSLLREQNQKFQSEHAPTPPSIYSLPLIGLLAGLDQARLDKATTQRLAGETEIQQYDNHLIAQAQEDLKNSR